MRRLFDRRTLRDDAVAGVVLGVESVPDGLAFGFLAGVNPLAGLYGYLYGMVGGALLSSTSVMAVQVTSAMGLIVADTDLTSHDDPVRALYTLSVLAGVFMVLAGLLRAGGLLRFVPRAVMVGFITGVGVNIVLGQLASLTGYDASGANRLTRTADLVANVWEVHAPTVIVGVLTLVLIVVLTRTRLGALGLVVAVVLGSAVAALFELFDHPVATVGDVTTVPHGLPLITAPVVGDVPGLLVPAVALAFVGMVQGAAVSAAYPNTDGSPSDASRDFVAQGSGSILSGLFQGMPAGGSMSATALVVQAGARTRLSLFIAGGVMAVIVVVAADAVGHVAFPALAALLIVVGVGTIRPAEVRSVVKTGAVQAAVLAVTFGLTVLIPVQQAVLAGVALAVVLFVISQSNRVVVKRLDLDEEGHIRESDPPAAVPPGEVVLLQPFGSLFFASATTFARQLPAVDHRHRARRGDPPHAGHRRPRRQHRQRDREVRRRLGRCRLAALAQRRRATPAAAHQERRPRQARSRLLLPQRCVARQDAPASRRRRPAVDHRPNRTGWRCDRSGLMTLASPLPVCRIA